MKEQSTTKGFAVLSAAGMFAKVLSLLYVPLLLATIGDEGHGIYAAAYDIFSLVYVMTSSGMQVAIAKQVSELMALNNPKDAIKTFKLARFGLMVLGTLAALIVIIFAGPISTYTGNPRSYYAIIALTPAMLVTSVLAAYRGYFQGLSVMTPTAVSQIIEQIANILFSLIFAYIMMKKSVDLGAAGGTIGTTIGAIIAGYYLAKAYKKSKGIRITKSVAETPVKRLSTKTLLRRLLKYGFPITLSSGMQYLGAVIDLTIVKKRLEVAGFLLTKERDIKYSLLSRYRTLLYVPLTIISALSSALLPAISRAVVLNNKKEVKEKIDFAFKISYIVSIPSAVGLAVLSKEIYRLIRYGAGHEIMTYGAIVVVFMAIVQIQTTILQSINRLYIVIVSLGVGILAKLITNYYLVAIPSININGAVIGSLLCFLIPMIINNIALNSALRVRISLIKVAVKPTLAAILMAVVIKILNANFSFILELVGNTYVLSSIFTLISVFVGMIVYLYGLVLTGGITKKDMKALPNKLTKLVPKFILNRLR
ncbi:putative polysaccharide biosynthesis protein [Clostridium amazonitimonense]|uniref:putative polysaccharide biosynthesis protein n=1 Tax=Clostridium amazonitimonense TaxID=1499689 RepID=UPI000509714B|nr:oligosaccharide flippase family protein [Clostridium amazonitimonense]